MSDKPMDIPVIPELVKQFISRNISVSIAALKDMQVADINEAALKAFGYTDRNEIIGHHISKFFTPESYEIALKRIARRVAGKTNKVNRVYDLINKAGNTFRMEITSVIWPTEPGVLIVIGVDVTEQDQQMAFLKESEKLYRSIAETIPAGVMLKNREGVNVYVNDQAALLTGYTKEELVSGTPLLHPDEKDAFNTYNSAYKGAAFKSLETKYIRKDGSEMWVSSSWEPVVNAKGELDGTCSAFLDITRLKQTEQELLHKTSVLQAIIEAFPDLYFRVDSSGIILDYLSGNMNDLYVNPELFIGKTLMDVMPDELTNQVATALAEVANNGTMASLEYHLNIQGREEYYEARMSPLLADQVVIVVRNITKRKMSEIALKESESRYRGLIESQQDFIVRCTPDYRLTFVNDAYCNLFDKSRDELLGNSFVPFLHDEDVESTLTEISKLKDSPYRCSTEARVLTKEGWRWLSWEDCAILDENCRIVEIQCIGRDITEKKQAGQRLIEAHANLEKAYKLQTEFLNNVTHEVRTPLTAVKGYIGMLLEGIAGPMNDEQKDLLRRVLTSSDQLLAMVEGVLEIAHLKSGGMSLRPKACKPAEIIKKAVAGVYPQARQHNIEISINQTNQEHVGMYDEDELMIVLSNILSNAVKFTRDGSINIIIENRPDGFEVVIVDSGIGIEEADLSGIFDEFKQLGMPKKHKPSGFGLGLAIVASAIEETGASIAVSSCRGVGTAFTIDVPSLTDYKCC